jgi:hypothetical protein
VDYNKMDLRDLGWDGIDWIDPAQNRDWWRALLNAVMNHQVPKNAEKFLSSLHNWWRLKKGSSL